MLGSLILSLLMQQVSVPTANGVVEGVLRTSDGKPAAGVRVSALIPPVAGNDVSSGEAMASIAETDTDGRYRLERIPPGRYYISGGRVDRPTYYPGTREFATGDLVTVTAGGTVSNLNFVLADTSSGRAESPNILSLAGLPGLTLPVTIQVEGGGRVPVFGNGKYSVVRFTKMPGNDPIELSFGRTSLILPIPTGTVTDEYKVAVDGLPDGYTVKSVFYGPTDLQKQTLKFSRQDLAIQSSLPGRGDSATAGPVLITLTATEVPASDGVQISGRSFGAGDDIYIGDIPGVLFRDGTFEFRGVPAGIYSIVKFAGTAMTAAPVVVREKNIENITLRAVQILPIDAYSAGVKLEGNTPASVAMSSIAGRVIDETSQEPLTQGSVTVIGYRNSRQSYAIIGGEGFRIPQLLPGRYELTLDVSGYRRTTQPIIVGFEDLVVELKAVRSPQ
jgi:hypothetical protein